MSTAPDLGSVINLAGPSALANGTYNPGTTFHAGRTGSLAVWLRVSFDAATTVTGIVLKLQATYDGTNWWDIPSTNNATTIDTQIEHTVAASAGNTVNYLLATESHRLSLNGMRVVAKGTGGATKTGDIVLGYGTAG
jgi:hypothetical protein